jgi:hypothetical protein
MNKFSPQLLVVQNDLRSNDGYPALRGDACWMATRYWPTGSKIERICILAEVFDDLSTQTFTTYSIRDRPVGAAVSRDDSFPEIAIHEEVYEISEEADIDPSDFAFKPRASQFSGAPGNIAFCARSEWDELVLGVLSPRGTRAPRSSIE